MAVLQSSTSPRMAIPTRTITNTSEPILSNSLKWHTFQLRERSACPKRHVTFVTSVAFALLWGFVIACITKEIPTAAAAAAEHNQVDFDRNESAKNAQLITNVALHNRADFDRHSSLFRGPTIDRNLQYGPPSFDRLPYCSNLAERLCGKCSSFYKMLVKKKRCKKKECKERFRRCMFGKDRKQARKFDIHCADRLMVRWPIVNIFGRKGRYKGRKFDYRKMRLVDWCRSPEVRRPRARNRDECGDEIDYFAEMEVLIDLYCPVNEENLPLQPQDERSAMERGFLLWANSEAACFGENECEQIRYETSTIQELQPGEDCCDLVYKAQGIPCPITDRLLLEEEYDGTIESFDALMSRQLQRRRKTKARKRFSGKCRSRNKKCNRKKKRRRLEVSFDSRSGLMSIPGGGGGKVATYSLRHDTIHDDEREGQGQNNLALHVPIPVARHLQTDVPVVNIGDLTPAECEALSLEESIRLQDPVAFRSITSTEEEEYDEYPCEDLSADECNSPLGRSVCCGVGSCKCDIASTSHCDKGTLFGTTRTQCYLNANGLQGNIASREDNLCCDLYVGPPLSYRYDCSASVCGPLPTAQCSKQPWINTIDSGPTNARAGSFSINVNFDIIDICSATLANRNSIEAAVRDVVDDYVKNLIEYSGCSRSNASQDGVTVNSVNVLANTDSCPGSSRRLGGAAWRELQPVTTCTDSATGQIASSVTFSAQIRGSFRTHRPLIFPVEGGIVYEGFNAPAPASTPAGENDCSCNSLICKEVRDALANTAGANVQNAGVTATGIQIEIATPDPTPSPSKAPSESPTKGPTRNPTSAVSCVTGRVGRV